MSLLSFESPSISRAPLAEAYAYSQPKEKCLLIVMLALTFVVRSLLKALTTLTLFVLEPDL